MLDIKKNHIEHVTNFYWLLRRDFVKQVQPHLGMSREIFS